MLEHSMPLQIFETLHVTGTHIVQQLQEDPKFILFAGPLECSFVSCNLVHLADVPDKCATCLWHHFSGQFCTKMIRPCLNCCAFAALLRGLCQTRIVCTPMHQKSTCPTKVNLLTLFVVVFSVVKTHKAVWTFQSRSLFMEQLKSLC